MMRYGEMVKIEDIGILAMFIQEAGDQVELELCGERFWIPDRLVSTIGDMN